MPIPVEKILQEIHQRIELYPNPCDIYVVEYRIGYPGQLDVVCSRPPTRLRNRYWYKWAERVAKVSASGEVNRIMSDDDVKGMLVMWRLRSA